MAKNNVMKKSQALEQDFDFDFEGLAEHDCGEHTSDMMGELLEASKDHMILALELTRLVVDKTSNKNLNEDNIFSIFKKATTVVSESSLLKPLIDTLSK